ncbi:tail fiber domain-containing protein [Pantoea septica]|uniref:tail fiber domain-containing protein n=1 Tax=Pantoea septica TaxID=472695 RepID=UPI00289FCB24|nr:tail fiber domain-containing protein [Pantoea septica]
MSAGTIALTNNSTAVSGTGTSFTTELKVGDFIGVIAGGTPYTLIVASISSNTQLTIGGAFAGPTASGLAWNGVPASLLYAVSQQIMNDMGTALRGMNSQLVNWQRIYSDASSVTVERPDSTSFTGPSWGYMAQQYASKANTTDVLTKADNLSSVEDKAVARKNLGLKGAAVLDVGNKVSTVAAGDDPRLNSIDGKSGGTISSPLYSTTKDFGFQCTVDGVSVSGNGATNLFGKAFGRSNNNYGQWDFYEVIGQYYASRIVVANDLSAGNFATFEFRGTGQGLSGIGWTTYSDKRLKPDAKIIDNPIDRLKKMRGYIYTKLGVKGTGVIAQEAQEALPEAVTDSGSFTTSEGETFENVLTLSPGDLVGLLIEVCRNQEERIQQRDDAIAELQNRMKAIDGLDA